MCSLFPLPIFPFLPSFCKRVTGRKFRLHTTLEKRVVVFPEAVLASKSPPHISPRAHNNELEVGKSGLKFVSRHNGSLSLICHRENAYWGVCCAHAHILAHEYYLRTVFVGELVALTNLCRRLKSVYLKSTISVKFANKIVAQCVVITNSPPTYYSIVVW